MSSADDVDAQQPALLFIPDISGFTRFVTETEVSHAQHITRDGPGLGPEGAIPKCARSFRITAGSCSVVIRQPAHNGHTPKHQWQTPGASEPPRSRRERLQAGRNFQK